MSTLRLSKDAPFGRGARVAYGAVLAALLPAGIRIGYQGAFEVIPWLWTVSFEDGTSVIGAVQAWFWAVFYTVAAPVLPVVLILHAIRAGATLDGTVLTVRGPFRTRSVDLSVARVHGEAPPDDSGYNSSGILLVASAPGRKPVRLDLGGYHGLLPRPQLSALADAIAAGGTCDEERRLVVERLRMFVRQPYARPRFLWADPPPRLPRTSSPEDATRA
ncbi:hypothetical protein AB0M36_24200 [Actinoplanes sp. NPDC051346]|uniref:hypothetical protein n=1 Tax=Actinoplanes sp. NPDC051346 TaxID=3155048 RepID=UPI0034225734